MRLLALAELRPAGAAGRRAQVQARITGERPATQPKSIVLAIDQVTARGGGGSNPRRALMIDFLACSESLPLLAPCGAYGHRCCVTWRPRRKSSSSTGSKRCTRATFSRRLAKPASRCSQGSARASSNIIRAAAAVDLVLTAACQRQGRWRAQTPIRRRCPPFCSHRRPRRRQKSPSAEAHAPFGEALRTVPPPTAVLAAALAAAAPPPAAHHARCAAAATDGRHARSSPVSARHPPSPVVVTPRGEAEEAAAE